MPFLSASENSTFVLIELVHALENPETASPFRKIADKHIAEIEDLRNIFKKENINQVPTKRIQEQPEIQKIENIPEKQLQTERKKLDTGPHIIPLEKLVNFHG